MQAVQKGKRSVRVKRSQSSLTLGGGDGEENDGGTVNNIRQSSSCGSLEDDCSSKGTTTTTTTTTTNTILNSSGKTRASRGSATDPQSLYARVNLPSFSFFILIIYCYYYNHCLPMYMN